MFDYLKKFKKDWLPEDILTDNSVDINFVSNNADDYENIELAKRLADHLNQILDYKDRVDAIDYLAAEAKKNFDNITFTTIDEGIVNSISAIGGDNGEVDFFLACDAVQLVIDWMDQTALESITGLNK